MVLVIGVVQRKIEFRCTINQIGGVMINMAIVVKLVKDGVPVICDPKRAQHYLDQGFRPIGDNDEGDEGTEGEEAERPVKGGTAKPVLVEKEVIDEKPLTPGTIDRQTAISIAVQHIFDRKEPDDFTSGGLPRVEVIATEAGVESVTVQERSVAMEAPRSKESK